MLTIDSNTLEKNFDEYFNKVTEDKEIISITLDSDKKVILVSEEIYKEKLAAVNNINK